MKNLPEHGQISQKIMENSFPFQRISVDCLNIYYSPQKTVFQILFQDDEVAKAAVLESGFYFMAVYFFILWY